MNVMFCKVCCFSHPGLLCAGAKMSEEAVRQTRSQKRALEREAPALDGDTKRVKLERGELGSSKVANILKSGEVKATIKVEVQADDEPVDMRTPRR